MKRVLRRVAGIVVIAVVIAGIAYGLQPRPVDVDVATVSRGPLVVTVSDDGQTRIRERYVVSAPLGGRLVRIQLESGDPVTADETLLTTIEPTDPALLDPRAAAEAEARVRAAEVRLKQATPRSEAIYERMQLAASELQRVRELEEKNAVTEQEVEEKEYTYRETALQYRAAAFETEIARYELELAKAALRRTGSEDDLQNWSFPIRSPISGRVLRVFQESSTIVNAGERIIELGDPQDLEVVVDVLSTDAVRIRPNARVVLTRWGGDDDLPGRVQRIEPSAFTKVSALGVEEQRVNVIIDFDDEPDQRPPLGDGYRVEAEIVEWESDDVLTVPAGALFRTGDDWAVFRVREDHAERRLITVGHRNDLSAEVRDGLQEGDRVVLYPADRVTDGTAVQARSPAN